jgi:hypothetical protein
MCKGCHETEHAPGCAWWKSGASAPRKKMIENPLPLRRRAQEPRRAWRGGMEAPCAAIPVWHSRSRLCLVEERRFSAAKKMIENPLPCAAEPGSPDALRAVGWKPHAQPYPAVIGGRAALQRREKMIKEATSLRRRLARRVAERAK